MKVFPESFPTCNFTGFGSDKFKARLKTDGSVQLCKANYGVIHMSMLCHQPAFKQHYGSKVVTSRTTHGGRMRGGVPKLGEMEIITLLNKGMTHVLEELTFSSDMVNVDICKSCRALVSNCFCDDLCTDSTTITTQWPLVKVDLANTTMSFHGESVYNDEVPSGLSVPRSKRPVSGTTSVFVYQ
ncbi:hypothetical protein BC830DRAFT_85119 [Chytriomyces sp. MP71]|nr:hypothetical protein BC830DRAFT_85119 [Chytriomyces sp. MP71]